MHSISFLVRSFPSITLLFFSWNGKSSTPTASQRNILTPSSPFHQHEYHGIPHPTGHIVRPHQRHQCHQHPPSPLSHPTPQFQPSNPSHHAWALGECHVDINIHQVCVTSDKGNRFVRTLANFHITDANYEPIAGLSGDSIPFDVDAFNIDIGVINGPDGFRFKWKWYERPKECMTCDVWDKMTYVFEPSGRELDDEGVSCTEKKRSWYQGIGGRWYAQCKKERVSLELGCGGECMLMFRVDEEQ
jgi:hypothetical protein